MCHRFLNTAHTTCEPAARRTRIVVDGEGGVGDLGLGEALGVLAAGCGVQLLRQVSGLGGREAALLVQQVQDANLALNEVQHVLVVHKLCKYSSEVSKFRGK